MTKRRFLNHCKLLFLVIAICMTISFPAMAGSTISSPIVNQTDFGSNRIVMYWDTRTRDTFLQVSNISNSLINVKVQIFNVNSNVVECEILTFNDTFTGNDTHLYNLNALITNAGTFIPSDFSSSYGFFVVSLTSGDPNSLIGVFSIFDDAGYQYRTNAASPEDSNAETTITQVINFNGANGNNLSDLVGIPYVSVDNETVYASPGVSITFGSPFDEILIYDEFEDDTSCSPTAFACAVGLMDKAIDNALPNSKGQSNRVCATNILNSQTSGWLELPFETFACTDPMVGTNGVCDFDAYFVGFIGLNNGNGTGSMDSWWSVGGVQ